MAYKKQEHKIAWSHVLVYFILGLLIATNIFLFVDKFDKQDQINNLNQQVTDLRKEVDKLKLDDVGIAQAVNDLLLKLEKIGVLPSNN